ncbi:aftiphilin a isoform X2 [Trichomycterus rosablanca]|uniref:aftiphilin a isoform X2 n=1 Tax=Trichomycterus rosablanca TaxID=2290929 RepID=UPI002F35526D
MEPDVIRMYPSSPPPLEEGGAGDGEEDDDEFSDFAGVPNSISFSEFETATTFDQLQALNATSPPELIGNGRVAGLHPNGDAPACRVVSVEELKRGRTNFSDVSGNLRNTSSDCNGGVGANEALTNGFASPDTQGTSPSSRKHKGTAFVETMPDGEDFADFAAFSDADVSAHSNHEERLAQDGVPPDDDRLSNGDWGFHDESAGAEVPPAQNGVPSDPRISPVSGDNTETETSFGRPLSTEALEEFGDFSTTGSVPSPPLQEDTATPAGDDGDFGDFGDFAPPESTRPDEFGESDAHGRAAREGEEGAEFPVSDSFADFASAPVGGDRDADDGWRAFDRSESNEDTGDSWAAFGQDQGQTFSETTPVQPADDRRDSLTASLLSRLEKLLLLGFPEVSAPHLENDVPPLKSLLEPPDRSEPEREEPTPARGAVRDVWARLQDVHSALGLRHQWGGSHCNKVLLCSLGIDTRNILFTGQKKQPVIVPMYAASLGMLEPTKEPVKPVSAAEMIASIAQSGLEMSTCPADAAQEPLPPVQFDWSSSGLTNPLDSVDPELYELTQAKLVVSAGGNKVADAFARLMSTAEKTNTSTRRLQQQQQQKEENLSEEARRVISTLPDLSFMQAKVLMFPSTLTPLPLSSCSSSSPSPVPD